MLAAAPPLQRRAVDAVEQVGVAIGRADGVADDVVTTGSDVLGRGGAAARCRRSRFRTGAAAGEERRTARGSQTSEGRQEQGERKRRRETGQGDLLSKIK